MTITPYCSKDQWAQKMGYTDWDTFAATNNDWPDANSLDEALQDGSVIMNDIEHIACGTTNISDTEYTDRLERINFNIANRMLDINSARGLQGGNMGPRSWSQADFLMSFERTFLINLGVIKGYRLVGGRGQT